MGTLTKIQNLNSNLNLDLDIETRKLTPLTTTMATTVARALHYTYALTCILMLPRHKFNLSTPDPVYKETPFAVQHDECARQGKSIIRHLSGFTFSSLFLLLFFVHFSVIFPPHFSRSIWSAGKFSARHDDDDDDDD